MLMTDVDVVFFLVVEPNILMATPCGGGITSPRLVRL
jgi:hypothetical protein